MHPFQAMPDSALGSFQDPCLVRWYCQRTPANCFGSLLAGTRYCFFVRLACLSKGIFLQPIAL